MKKSMKRALSMFVVLCMLVASIPQVIFASDYENHWAKEAIEKWSKKEIVVGYEDGTFRPSNQITRGELSTILVRVFNLSDTANARQYDDVAADKWYAQPIAIASTAKLMHEEGDKFRPDDPATREEAAYAIAKAYKISGAIYNEFTDEASISDWASDAVSALAEKGFLNGYPDGTFGPKRTLSRAEVVTMLDNITDGLINIAGTYTDDVSGNLVVNTRDVILKDMTISGNLYLTEGIGDGDVTLENITVEGETFVNGGGLNSIKSKDSKFLQRIKVSAKNPVRLVIVGDAVKVEAFPGTTVTLTGNFSDVILPPGVNVIVKDATVGKIFIEPGFAEDKDLSKALITIEEGATVKNIQADAPVETKGKGKIENLVVNSDGVKTEQEPTKTEIKDEDIKADIAGKEETKETIEAEKPKTPSTGGGGGGGSSSESTPSKYRISGKVTYDGKGLEGVHVNIWVPGTGQFDTYVQTDENGNYTFYVPSKHTYQIGASFVDEKRFGYEKTVYPVTANSNKTIDIELEKAYVANINVVDTNSNPISRGVRLYEVEDSKETKSNWGADTNGHVTIWLNDEGETDREFNIYVDDVLVGNLKGVKRGKDYRTEYTVKLDIGLGKEIAGKAVNADGSPAKNVTIYLYKIVPIDTQHSNWENAGFTTTDDQGNYEFKIEEPTFDHVVKSYYEKDNNCYVSQDLNALLVGKKNLMIKQSYSIAVAVTDKNGLGINDGKIRVTSDDDSGWHETSIHRGGTQVIYYYELVPGKYKVQVTVGKEVNITPITIIEGQYNNSLDFKFDKVKQKTLILKLKNQSITVGEATIDATSVTLAEGNGQSWANFDENSEATLVIPDDFAYDEASLFISSNEGFLICRKDINLTNLGILEVDLENEVQRLTLVGELNIAQTTTGSAIELSTPSSITLKIDDGNEGKEVAKRDVDKDTIEFTIDKLIGRRYTLLIEYTIDGQNYTFEKELSIELNGIWGKLEGDEWGSIPIPIVIDKDDHTLTITLTAKK